MRDIDCGISIEQTGGASQTSWSEMGSGGNAGTATDAFIAIDDEQNITLFNTAAEKMFRCPAAEAIGGPLSRFIPERFRDLYRKHIGAFGEAGVSTRPVGAGQPLTALRTGGAEFLVELTVSHTVTAGRSFFTAILREVGDAGDLGDAAAGEVADRSGPEALRKSEERYRTLFEYAPDGIVIANPRGRCVDANPSICRMLGYAREEMIGLYTSDVLVPPESGRAEPAPDTSDAHVERTREHQLRRRDGSVFPAEVIATLMPDGNRMAMVRDVTDRRRAEETRAMMAAIVESSDDAIVGKTLEGIVTTWNGGAERLFGYTAAEMVGKSVLLLIPPERRHEEVNILSALSRGEPMDHLETVRVTKDGRHIDVSLSVSPIRNSAGEIIGGSKIVRDISARKRAEESLARHAEALARSNLELERFAYVASHDLQEPMRTVRSFAQLLRRRFGDAIKGDGEEYLRFISSGVTRMEALINDLLSYSRVGSQGAPFAPADCRDIFAKVLENLRASISYNHAEVTADPLPFVFGDATQIGQVLQNLLVNAIKFHGERPPRIHVSVKEAAREWAFSVRDNGIGIAPEYFDRIFIIFQRLHTIEEYGGTGIGLAICKKIVERHGGRIWVESVVGEGSTFHFSIPKREKAA